MREGFQTGNEGRIRHTFSASNSSRATTEVQPAEASVEKQVGVLLSSLSDPMLGRNDKSLRANPCKPRLCYWWIGTTITQPGGYGVNKAVGVVAIEHGSLEQPTDVEAFQLHRIFIHLFLAMVLQSALFTKHSIFL